jgi:hypothetical protein
MFTQYLKVADGKNGKGTFTSIEIPAGVPIAEANGPTHILNVSKTNNPNWLQVGVDIFMAASGHMLPDYINHSCDPNCYFHMMGNRAILYSLYVISVGAELTFDYSTTSTDTMETWQMQCACGSHKCRKTISGYQSLNPTLQEEYKSKGMIPLFITTQMFQKR